MSYQEDYELLKKWYVEFVQLVLENEHLLDQEFQGREQERLCSEIRRSLFELIL